MAEQEVTCLVKKRPVTEARPVVVIQPQENSCNRDLPHLGVISYTYDKGEGVDVLSEQQSFQIEARPAFAFLPCVFRCFNLVQVLCILHMRCILEIMLTKVLTIL